MDLRKVHLYIDRICPRASHRTGHTIIPIPGRDDVCLTFCKGWGSRVFLVWEFNGKIRHDLIGGLDGYQVIVNEDTLTLKGNILRFYCSCLNFIGASPCAQMAYDLGKLGNANPAPVKA